jgi:phospholipid/cholesterol/gamma-HCH transport system substrate-binding protein
MMSCRTVKPISVRLSTIDDEHWQQRKRLMIGYRMDYNSSEIKAGLFMIASIVVVLAFLVVILGLTQWGESAQYRARFSYVGGIEKGSLVRYAGMEVGKVISFSLPEPGDTRVQIIFEVKKGTPLRSNSEAFLSTIGLMGAYYIEISSGTQDAPLLTHGSLVPSKDITGIAQMTGPMTDATSQATELLKRLNDLLNDENRRYMSETLAVLHRMATENAETTHVMLQNVTLLTENLNNTVQRINTMISRNDSTMNKSMVELNQLLGESRMLAQQMNTTLQTLDGTMLENRSNLSQMLVNSERLTRNLQEFSQTIKEQPWNLVRKNYAPERKLP